MKTVELVGCLVLVGNIEFRFENEKDAQRFVMELMTKELEK